MKRRANCSNIIFVSVLTVAYIAFFVLFIWIRQWQTAGNDHSIFLPYLLRDIAISLAQIFCLFFALTMHRYIFLVLLPIIFAASSLCCYMIYKYAVAINEQMIGALFDTNIHEIQQFITTPLVAIIAGAIVLSLFAITYFLKNVTIKPQEYNAAKTFVVITVFLIIPLNSMRNVSSPPYNIIKSSLNYSWEQIFSQASIKKPDNYSYLPKNKPVKVVLMIGESARADHFELNGYDRSTNPYTSRRKNLLSFKQAISCGAFTRIAVPCIITMPSLDGSGITSLFGVFNSLGFQTAWLGSQGALSNLIMEIISEAKNSILLENRKMLENSVLDEELLPLFDKELEGSIGKPLFVVLHLYGSHWQYQARYPEKFEYFTPTCKKTYMREFAATKQVEEIKSCSDLRLINNSYDNSIVYTDYIVDQVIGRLLDENAIVVYMSDHGESLGEKGRYLHGNEEAPEQRHIPMLWWASDKFISSHSNEWYNISQKTDYEFKQNNLFNSLLDCMQIQSPSINKSKSLCDKGYGLEIKQNAKSTIAKTLKDNK